MGWANRRAAQFLGPSEAVLRIEDNGVGFEVLRDWLELARRGHLGLVGMRERAEAIGGQFEVRSSPGNGTSITVRLPISSGLLSDPVTDH